MIDISRTINDFAEQPYLIGAGSGEELSYARTAFASIDLSRWLHEQGVVRGDRLALFMPNSLELACAYLACLFGGIVAVPINAKYSLDDREYLLAISGAKACLCMEEARCLIPDGYTGEILRVSTEATERAWTLPDHIESGRPQVPDIDYDALFTITFTSGTTGRPKGICHSARTLLTNATAYNKVLSISSRNRYFHAMPMTYMAGILNNLLCPFMAGASVVVEREFDARMSLDFWTPIIRHKVNCMWTSPTVLGLLLQMDRGTDGEEYCRQNLSFIASCTAPLTGAVQKDFEERYGCPVLPSFGLSETLINTIDCPERRCGEGSCGRALPTVDFLVVDEVGNTCPAGETGEMLVRSKGQMLGYLEPAIHLPDQLPRDHWFATGDMGLIDESGCVFITDRKKDLIIRGGINISPAKVEGALLSHDAIAEAAVIGLPDPVLGERVVTVLRLVSGYVASDDLFNELKKLCGESVEQIAIPERFFVMDDFPRSSTGKVKKAALREQLVGA